MKKNLVLSIFLTACFMATSCKKSDVPKQTTLTINPVGYFKGIVRDNILNSNFPCAFLIRDNGSARSYIASSTTQTDTANMVKKEQVWTLTGNTFHSEDVVATNNFGKGKLDAMLSAPTDSIVGIFSNNFANYPINLKRQ